MLHDLLLVAAGLALLFVGGEGLVQGAVAVAERFSISKLLIGLLIVGFQPVNHNERKQPKAK